jgi:hypothetical protein
MSEFYFALFIHHLVLCVGLHFLEERLGSIPVIQFPFRQLCPSCSSSQLQHIATMPLRLEAVPLLAALIFQESSAQAPVCLSDDDGNCIPCGLYLAESIINEDRLTFFSGVDRPKGSIVGSGELVLSIVDANKNEYSPWHDMIWPHWLPEALLDNNFTHDVFVGGISSQAACGGRRANIEAPSRESYGSDNSGVHRASDPTAGSFSYHQMYQTTSKPVEAGDELFLNCPNKDIDFLDKSIASKPPQSRSLEWLEENGMCVDTLTVGPSALPGAGRGAFLQRPVAAGNVIIPSPLVYFDRSQLEIVKQEYKDVATVIIPFLREHGIEYDSETVTGYQLALNYCYGRADSNVMLLPTAPAVNFINHSPSKVNAYIRWSERFGETNEEVKSIPLMELYETPVGEQGELVMEFVALRDLSPGEEVYIDYGRDWQEAWKKHSSEWEKGTSRNEYISAPEYNELHRGEPIRTEQEQLKQAYPENLQIACLFSNEEGSGETLVQWSDDNSDDECLRPCVAKERVDSTYTVVVYSNENRLAQKECVPIPKGGITITGVPERAIVLVDRPYSTDKYMPSAFRQEIGVPEDFYPRNWLAADPNPYGDFIPSPLSPGSMAPIRWKGSAEVVTPWAFRIGVPASVRQVLLDYCHKKGITDIFRHVTTKGNALEAGENGFFDLDGHSWYLQRPGPEWRSNLHWLSPGGPEAQEDYLQALGAAGFDEMLEGVGKYLDMSGLVAFHVTFIAVSRATRGYLHHDVLQTSAKTYNVIIPLMLVNETGPELDLQTGASFDEDFAEVDHIVGRYRYEYEVASMLGDGAVHATSAVDYRKSKEMRMAATVYIADVNERNVNGILNEYTQSYPPRERDLLLGWAGRHWNKDDPAAKLPKPGPNHILVRPEATASS